MSEMRVLGEWGIEASHRGGEDLACEVKLLREPHEERRGGEADVFVYVRMSVRMRRRRGKVM